MLNLEIANSNDKSSESNATQQVSDNIGKKMLREVQVIGQGLAYGITDSLKTIPEKLPNLGTSLGLGLSMGFLSKIDVFGPWLSAEVGAMALGVWGWNTCHDKARWNTLGSACKDAWQSSDHLDADVQKVRGSLGTFVGDNALLLAASGIGFAGGSAACTKIADSLLSGTSVMESSTVLNTGAAGYQSRAMLRESLIEEIPPPNRFSLTKQDLSTVFNRVQTVPRFPIIPLIYLYPNDSKPKGVIQ